MIRTFLEFLISRTLDDTTPPSGWFRRLLLRNAGLRRFDTETQQLDVLLRTSATEQRQSMAADSNAVVLTLPPQRQEPPAVAVENYSRHTLAWLSGLAAAALVLVALAPNWFRPALPAAHAGEFSQQLTVVPGELLRLLTRAAKTSQTQLPKLSPLANMTLPTLPAWEEIALRVESPMRQEMETWQESWQNLTSRWPIDSREL